MRARGWLNVSHGRRPLLLTSVLGEVSGFQRAPLPLPLLASGDVSEPPEEAGGLAPKAWLPTTHPVGSRYSLTHSLTVCLSRGARGTLTFCDFKVRKSPPFLPPSHFLGINICQSRSLKHCV